MSDPAEEKRDRPRRAARLRQPVRRLAEASRHRELDRTLDVRYRGERRLLHLEWQGEMPAHMPFRSFECQLLMAIAMAANSRASSMW